MPMYGGCEEEVVEIVEEEVVQAPDVVEVEEEIIYD